MEHGSMSGYQTILKIRRLEQEIDALGFRWGNSKRSYGHDLEYGGTVALFPKNDESLPVYNRDAELFTGTIEQLEVWLRGVKWARDYDMLVRLSTTVKRDRKEQDCRNRNLVKLLSKVEDDE
jgi:hypothetical protein